MDGRAITTFDETRKVSRLVLVTKWWSPLMTAYDRERLPRSCEVYRGLKGPKTTLCVEIVARSDCSFCRSS
jgi:hypothetical protein